MPYQYPILLNLCAQKCLVAGLGQVGMRKVQGLLNAGAENITGLDVRILADLPEICQKLVKSGLIIYERRTCHLSDVKESSLVFAATSDKEENKRIAKMCAEEKVLCNCATDPENGSFTLPVVVMKSGMTATFSTGGQSPALAKQSKKELEQWLESKSRLAVLLGKLRKNILANSQESELNAELFRKIAASPVQLWLAQGEIDKCGQWLKKNLPACLKIDIEQLLQN